MWVDKNDRQIDFETSDNNNRKDKIEAIKNNMIYAQKSESDHLSGLYHLVFWKNYLKEKNTQKLYLAI